jgi:hypothetical protein
MSRPVLEAIGRLSARGLLTPEREAFLVRIARRGLVSVRLELQLALWAGVMLIAGGAGLLVRENLARLGPLTIGAGIGLAAALCLGHVARTAPPFSWGPVASPTLAFDYVLLLGVLLVGTDLLWLETQLTILGPAWPWHLLLLSLLQLAFAVRYDSRAVLSLALASFAAWRGVSLSLAGADRLGAHEELLRLNALAVGALFIGAGLLLRRSGRKTHFEPMLVNFGLFLLLGSAVAGVFGGRGAAAPAWGIVLAAASAATIFLAWRARRSDCFAQGVVAAFLGAVRLVFSLHLEEGAFFLVSAGSFCALYLILLAHRRFREEP